MELRLDGVGHACGDFEVMRNIGLDIASGEILCIAGPSGCGKSTLLGIIGGLERPRTGRVLQAGVPPEGCLTPADLHLSGFRAPGLATPRVGQCRAGSRNPRA